MQHAFIAVEDHRFYRHLGIDPLALARAVFRNVKEPGTVEGGSTLTQQLARTLFLSNQQSYGRKIREAVLALMIEAQLTKDEVLDPGLCAELLEGMLPLDELLRASGQYGPRVPVPDDARPQDRLMAFIGRDPGWRPDLKRSGHRPQGAGSG